MVSISGLSRIGGDLNTHQIDISQHESCSKLLAVFNVADFSGRICVRIKEFSCSRSDSARTGDDRCTAIGVRSGND